MRVPLSLLRSFCDPDLSAEEIASALALSGTEVERVRRIGVDGVENFLIGRVIEAAPHPDADRLRVCQVDIGADEPSTIVCGAPNVASGQTVVVATPGAIMPDGTKIKRAKLRGVESNGMICAEDELGLGEGHEGILVLDESSAAPGERADSILPLGEIVLDLEITPNRPDCLGVYGIARELHAATGAPLAAAPWEIDHGTEGPVEGASVSVEVPDLCARFTARVYEGTAPAETPIEIRAHLHAAGMRSISPVVDITNYAMLVIGEPLHAFDLDRIEGGALSVKAADEGQQIETLDGQTRTLAAGEVVIVDGGGPTSIAGVMGGARSEVSDSTTRVLLEAAVWNGPSINSTAARLVLRSEASGRFEKGVAPVQAMRAQAFASQLFERIYSIKPNPGTIDITHGPQVPAEIELSFSKVQSLIGSDIDQTRIESALSGLGFGLNLTDGGATVTPPADRIDVSRAIDLVEEIARIDGLERIPATLPKRSDGGGRLSADQRLARSAADALVAAGLLETAGWSFASATFADRLALASDDPLRSAIEIQNPMSEEESQLRTTLVTSLLEAASANAARGAEAIRLFEIGRVYLPAGDGLSNEPMHIGAILSGPSRQVGWRDQQPPDSDVHSALAVVGTLMSRLRCEWVAAPAKQSLRFLIPGSAATLLIDGQDVGFAGELHPSVAAEFGLQTASLFELEFSALAVGSVRVPHYRSISPHPAVNQDLAVIVAEGVSSGSLVATATTAGGDLIESVSIFDVYSGDQVGEGMVSIGLRLTFRAPDRTLTEEEASLARAAILVALENEHGASGRG